VAWINFFTATASQILIFLFVSVNVTSSRSENATKRNTTDQGNSDRQIDERVENLLEDSALSEPGYENRSSRFRTRQSQKRTQLRWFPAN